MEIRSYNAELAYANLMFSRLFRNIILERTINGKTTQFTVNCLLGQRSRILKNFQNPNKQAMYKLPMIIINRTGIFRNSARLNNLHNEIKYQQSQNFQVILIKFYQILYVFSIMTYLLVVYILNIQIQY